MIRNPSAIPRNWPTFHCPHSLDYSSSVSQNPHRPESILKWEDERDPVLMMMCVYFNLERFIKWLFINLGSHFHSWAHIHPSLYSLRRFPFQHIHSGRPVDFLINLRDFPGRYRIHFVLWTDRETGPRWGFYPPAYVCMSSRRRRPMRRRQRVALFVLWWEEGWHRIGTTINKIQTGCPGVGGLEQTEMDEWINRATPNRRDRRMMVQNGMRCVPVVTRERIFIGLRKC